MLATTSFTTRVSYISQLQHALSELSATPNWFVIAHDDPGLIQRVESSLTAIGTGVVLRVSQDLWDFHDSDLAEAIEWFLRHAAVDRLILVGDSSATGPVATATSKRRHGPYSAYGRLVNGVRTTGDRSKAAQERFASLIQLLIKIPTVQARLMAGELSIHGLFRRIESGVLLSFDLESGSFEPLIGSHL